MRFFLLIRTWIICILLAAVAIFFCYQTFTIWFSNDKLEVKKPVQKTSKRHVNKRVAYRRNPRYNSYEVIAQKDLFSRDRREKSPTPAPVKAAQSLDSRFALFGIVVNGSEKKALVLNLNKKDAKEEEYIWVKVGDKMGNLSVSEIQPHHIIITQGGSSYTIRLSDHNRSQKRAIWKRKKKPNEPKTTIIKKQKVTSPSKR